MTADLELRDLVSHLIWEHPVVIFYFIMRQYLFSTLREKKRSGAVLKPKTLGRDVPDSRPRPGVVLYRV